MLDWLPAAIEATPELPSATQILGKVLGDGFVKQIRPPRACPMRRLVLAGGKPDTNVATEIVSVIVAMHILILFMATMGVNDGSGENQGAPFQTEALV